GPRVGPGPPGQEPIRGGRGGPPVVIAPRAERRDVARPVLGHAAAGGPMRGGLAVPSPEPSNPAAIVSVPIGRWAVAGAPTQIRALLGSCAGVVLFNRAARLGGVAHIVLPDSRGAADHPGKFADTAIPAMIGEIERKLGRAAGGRLTAKLVGGASM